MIVGADNVKENSNVVIAASDENEDILNGKNLNSCACIVFQFTCNNTLKFSEKMVSLECSSPVDII